MRRPRRRGSRISDSPDYDRTADIPSKYSNAPAQQPDVDADPEHEPELGDAERLLEEKPPHY